MENMKKTILFLIVAFTLPVYSDGFYGVHSPDGSSVWAVGNSGRVFYSYDGGVTWSTFTRGSGTLRSVYSYGPRV